MPSKDSLLKPLHRLARLGAALGLGLLAGGCALLTARNEPNDLVTRVPPHWNAPLPHGGSGTDLALWWQELDDPLLLQLIAASQKESPTLAGAASRLAQARAALGSARGANQPSLSATASAQRGVSSVSPTVGTGLQSSLDASWELDLFGANRNTAQAAEARLQGSGAQWHEARVSVAAETATVYFGWHSCTQVLALVQADTASRSETARLAELSVRAGFTAPAVAALAQAGAAEGRTRSAQQSLQCDSSVKALVALTALEESDLRQRLNSATRQASPASLPGVASVPADALSQRPDLYNAEREVAAASADLGAAQAQRYPRLALNGSIGTLNYSSAQGTTDLSTWSIGPLSVSLPLLDGGRRAANVEVAQARYTEAVALYQARVRQAVREVEDALLSLASTDAQKHDAARAAQGYSTSFKATQARYQAGAASLPELEDARRITLAAQTTLLQLDLQRTQAWIALYRALGGGWKRDAAVPQDKS